MHNVLGLQQQQHVLDFATGMQRDVLDTLKQMRAPIDGHKPTDQSIPATDMVTMQHSSIPAMPQQLLPM
jgi:hypothetical protein